MTKLQGQNLLYYGGEEYSPTDLIERYTSQHKHDYREKICIASDDHLMLCAAVAACYGNDADFILLPKSRLTPAVKEVVELTRQADPGTISILTSGTTGTPKLYRHSWKSLTTHTRVADWKPLNWLMTYTPGTYAWYQMISLFMFAPEQHLTVSAEELPEAIWEAGVQSQSTAISSTPSFWRHLLLTLSREQLAEMPLEQITLGGERVSQDILDRLKTIYPDARISHIYASTEAGVGVVVNDGKAGFPNTWLEQDEPGRPQLKVVENVLYIRSPHSSKDVEEWHCTGDLVEPDGDRIFIIGRDEDGILNVGGRKVSKQSVEDMICDYPGVIWANPTVKETKLAGSLLVCELVIDKKECSEEQLEQRLTEYCKSKGVEEWMVPRMFNVREKVPLKANFKS